MQRFRHKINGCQISSSISALLIFILCSLLIYAAPLQAQENNFNSSRKITAQHPENETRRISNYLDTSEFLKKNFEYDKALDYALKALQESESANNAYFKAKSAQAVGDRYYYSNDFRNSITYFVLALNRANQLNDSVLVSDISIDLGFTYAVNGRPDSAYLHALNALHYYETKHSPVNTSWCYRILGDIQYGLNNFSKAQSFYEKGVHILENEPKKDSLIYRELSVQIAGVAMALADQNKINEAVYYYKISDSVASLCKAKDIIVGNQYGISYAYIYQREYAKAVSICKQALKYYTETDDRFYLEGCWESLGRAYVFSNQLDSAEYYLKMAEASAKQNDGYEFLKEVYMLLSTLYEKKGDAEKSLSYYKLFKEHTDSLYSQNKMSQLNVLEVAHDYEDYEKEKQILEDKRMQDAAFMSAQKRTNIFITIAFFLSLLSASLLGVLYYQKRNKSKHLQEEVKKRTEELFNANADLKNANAELQEFAHISFHDLREPLRNITSFTNLIRKKREQITSDELDDYTSIILTNAKQMQLLVYDVFEFVNINGDKKELDVFSPDTLLDDVIKVLDPSIKEKSAVVTKSIQVDNITSNKGMLAIALRNLLENAVKYNTSQNPQIHVQMHNGNNKYTWYVKDNGIGIEAQYHHRIFEMFKRLHNREKYQGSGLGLSITKKIIEKLHGEIGVISEEGKGSTFWFSIPKVD